MAISPAVKKLQRDVARLQARVSELEEKAELSAAGIAGVAGRIDETNGVVATQGIRLANHENRIYALEDQSPVQPPPPPGG